MFKEISGKNISLIAIRPEHNEAIYAYASDHETIQYMSWPRHKSIEDTNQFINMTLEQYQTGTHYDWAVYHNTEATIIGTCGLLAFNQTTNSAHAGYILAKPYWHQGLGSKILGMLVHFGFKELKLHSIEALCEPENIASERVMQKNNFHYMGIVSYNPIKSSKPIKAKKYVLHSSEYHF